MNSFLTSLNTLYSIIEEKSNKYTFGTSEKKQVSLTEFIHMSMGKQNLDLKMYLRELWDLNFTLLLALMIFCSMVLKTQFSSKVDLSGIGTELFNY